MSSPSDPTQPQPSSPSEPIFIRQLPQYYPTKLHEVNLQLAKIPQIAQAANFLDVPPLFLCIFVFLVLVILIFAKFIVNFIIIIALLATSMYNCLYITAVLDEIVFSQIFSLTASLVFLAVYVLFSPIVDLCFDWVPFYHPAKLFIAFALTYQSYPTKVNPDGTISHDNNPFPLVSVDGKQFDQQHPSQMNKVPQKLHHVPEVPPTVKMCIDLIQSMILLGRGYVLRAFRIRIWAIRTWAYNLKVRYSDQENILDDVEFDFPTPTQQSPSSPNNNNHSGGDDIDVHLEDLNGDDDGFTLVRDVGPYRA